MTPILTHVDLKTELAHHRDGQLEIGKLVELAADLDRRRLQREWRQQQKTRDPLRQGPVDPDRAARGRSRVNRHRKALPRRLQANPEPLERAQQRTDGAPAEVALADE